MKEVKRGQIRAIYYPNTRVDNRDVFRTGSNCDEIREIQKNGEYDDIAWLQIINDNTVIAEIKETFCDIYFDDPSPKKWSGRI